MISICVPVYNGSLYLEECINSILHQSFKNFELIVCDDCSSDNSLEILYKYNDDRIVIYSNKINIGWVKNCNFLISKTNYQYFCIIPCDDYIPSNYLEKLYLTMIKDESMVNCYPHIISFGKKNYRIHQKSLNQESTIERVIDFIMHHFKGVSFRGLIKKSKNMDLLFLNIYLQDDKFADTFQIFQHAIEGKLIEVDVPYYKRYHDNNTHSKWNDDVIDLYLSIYMFAKNFFNDTDLKLCHDTIYQKCQNTSFLIKNSFDIIVMGGGIQGSCVSLFLKKLGYNVCIIEKNNSLMKGASENNEGKIHLGFVYSNDKTLDTAKKMLVDALHFSNIIEFLLDEKIDWDAIKSKKFLYLVPKTSLMKENELDEYFPKIQNLYDEMIQKNYKLNYLGKRPPKLYEKIKTVDCMNPEYFQCCYETEEFSINQFYLNEKIIHTIKKKGIPVFLENHIKNMKIHLGYYEIITDKGYYYSNRVVNCLWENKTKIDNCFNEKKNYTTNFRYKFGILSKPIMDLQNERSITFVNGPFGDFVNFPDYMYFSWYPYSMKGFSVSDKPPDDWKFETLIENKQEFIQLHKNIFNDIFKRKFDFIDPKIIGSIIVAKGDKDIDNVDSELHKRCEKRIDYKKNYFSISTGKYTSGPYNSFLLAEIIGKCL